MAVSPDDVLREVALLGECRANDIQARLTQKQGREVQFGPIFQHLDRLTEGGQLSYRLGDPDPQRGQRRARLYRITESGRTSLTRSAEATRAPHPETPMGPRPVPQT